MLMEMLVVSTVFALSLGWRTQRLSQQSGVMIYSLRNHTAIVVVQGFNCVLLCDEELLAEPSAIDYSLKGAWSKWHLSAHPQVVGLSEDFDGNYLRKSQNLVSFHGVLLALWDETRCDDSLSYRLPVDYLLVTGKQKPDIQSIVNGYDMRMLIIDGSVPNYLAERWVSQAVEKGIPYNIREGVVEIEF